MTKQAQVGTRWQLRGRRRWLMVALAGFGFAVFYGGPAVSQAVSQGDLASRISLELKEAEVGEVLAALAGILKVKLEAPASDRLVTTTLHHVRASTALQVVCESVGCVATVGDAVLRVQWVDRPNDTSASGAADALGNEPRANAQSEPSQDLLRVAVADETLRRLDGFDELLTLSLRDAELREVLGVFHKVLPGRLKIDEGVKGKVTVELKAVPAWQALEQICKVNACRFVVETNPSVVHILPR